MPFFKDNKQNMRPDNPSSQIKYLKPKILLMDVNPAVGMYLRNLGYNVDEGSFGKPYQTHPGFNFNVINGKLPKFYLEAEVVIIDLSIDLFLSTAYETENNNLQIINSPSFNLNYEVIDPRPGFMRTHQENFDTIYQHGGVFIIFASDRTTSNFTPYIRDYLSPFDKPNTWSFLSRLNYLNVDAQKGQEIFTSSVGILGEILDRYIKNSSYECVFEFPSQEYWFSFAQDKYQNDVACINVPSNTQEGLILILPQIQKKEELLEDLLKEYLPSVMPHLFPFSESTSWLKQEAYEHPIVLNFQNEIKTIEEETEKRIAGIKSKIDTQRSQLQYLHDLLSQTGAPLVNAVEHALKVLGFKDVLNVDEELKQSENNHTNREDLRINEVSMPLVLAEIKGITGALAKESDALQVSNYIKPQMKKLQRFDVRGLVIINHQRNIPPLERKPTPFTDDVIESAKQQEIGLLTTWSLFRLIRSYLKLGWKHEYVRDLFYQDGLIEPIPTHYEYIGIIEHVYSKAITITVEKDAINLGDRLAFETPVEFDELDVESLQRKKEPVQVVQIGELAGVGTKIQGLRKGYRVFKINSNLANK